MALGVCAVCGYFGDIEQHHVAGEANFPDLTVPVCPGCHSELHKRLSACGVNLAFVDRIRALLVGYSVLFGLHLEYHPNPLLPVRVVTQMARVLSRTLDQAEPAGRAGRWLPDPTVRVDEVAPVESRPGGDQDMLILFMRCAVDVIDAVEHTPYHDAPEVKALRIVAADPIGFIAKAEQILASRHTSQQLLDDMASTAEQTDRLLHCLATHDPDAALPPEMLDEARIYGDTQRRLLDQLVELAGLTAEVDP